MPLRMPDWLRYELLDLIERIRERRGEGFRDWLNESPVLIFSVTLLSILLCLTILFLSWRSTDGTVVQESRTVWFYDLNTGELFEESRKECGPIDTSSGPTLKGEPAGVRAHVYSYVLDPNEDELFVGFLDRPDPNTPNERPSYRRDNFEKWAQHRVIKKVEDTSWVSVTSQAGMALIHSLSNPNRKGQTPIYQLPRQQ